MNTKKRIWEYLRERENVKMKYKPNYHLMHKNWRGITYPAINGWMPNWFYFVWKKLFCCKGWHLFDEVSSCLGHRLSCDACDMEIMIDDNEYEFDDI